MLSVGVLTPWSKSDMPVVIAGVRNFQPAITNGIISQFYELSAHAGGLFWNGEWCYGV